VILKAREVLSKPWLEQSPHQTEKSSAHTQAQHKHIQIQTPSLLPQANHILSNQEMPPAKLRGEV